MFFTRVPIFYKLAHDVTDIILLWVSAIKTLNQQTPVLYSQACSVMLYSQYFSCWDRVIPKSQRMTRLLDIILLAFGFCLRYKIDAFIQIARANVHVS